MIQSLSVHSKEHSRLTGKTIKLGLTPSAGLAAFRSISCTWRRLSSLEGPIFPSCIRAILNGLNAGAVDMYRDDDLRTRYQVSMHQTPADPT